MKTEEFQKLVNGILQDVIFLDNYDFKVKMTKNEFQSRKFSIMPVLDIHGPKTKVSYFKVSFEDQYVVFTGVV